MCEVFISANPESYESRTRSVRLHGVVTSIRLENLHWEVLEEIGLRDGMTVTQLLEKLYDALVIPGGRAPEYLRMNKQVIGIVQHFSRENKPIAAVCHGAQLLAAAGVIRGKRVSAYPACAAEVELAGASYADIPVDQAVTDGKLVTAPAWPAHAAWLAQFLVVLGTRVEA